MAYLVGEIFLSLLAAAIIGGVIGWLLCRWTMAERSDEARPQRRTPGAPR